ncbi:MAG TPA: GNVR domain-containing protein [Gemmatimonadaceae bacterium]|nr:GNVR domain-containing protein [Gemmatimonadaceae bacterium]
MLNILNIEGATERERLSRGVRLLRKQAQSNVDETTGIVTLSVELDDPELAAAVANRMLQLLDRFNTTQRQTQSRQERIFVEGRLKEAEKELRAAEQQQVQFLEANRQYQQSPLLTVEANRLDQQVQTKQEAFLTLTKAYEDAKIAEVRDTPSITVVDAAVPPVMRSSPRRLLFLLVGLFLGVLTAGAVVYLLDFRRLAYRLDRRGPATGRTGIGSYDGIVDGSDREAGAIDR